jgi:LacI family transcriptional regulator
MPKVTLRVLAEETGLSKFAVSRALSGKSGVSEETRLRVVEAARRLGYRLADGPQAAVLGVVFDDRDHVNAELHMQMQSGLQAEAIRLGYATRVHWLQRPGDFEPLLAACAGLLAVNLQDPGDVALLARWSRPVVRSGWIEPLEPMDAIGGADHESGAAVARLLLGLGHREVAYVHGEGDLRGRWERLYGLREVIEREGGARYHHLRWEAGGGFAERLAALLADGIRPTAFFCAHDGLALTVVSDLLRLGWRIPEEASVVGFGDFTVARMIRPELTTIRTPGREMGAAAARLLDLRIRDPGAFQGPVRLMIPNRVVERASLGPAPGRAPAA